MTALHPDGRRELVQVCADPSSPATIERELDALGAAAREIPGATPRLLSATD